MHITIISGSHRKNAQSEKVANFIVGQLPQLQTGVSASVLSLAGNPLPLWDGEAAKPESATGKVWPKMAEQLQAAQAFVVISPEWHGMVPAGLKNLFLHTSAKEVGHKPALIVTVSAGRGGTYPVAELRDFSVKNNRMLYIPEHIIVQGAGNVLNGPESAGADDTYIRGRITFALKQLLAYGRALEGVRKEGVTEDPAYPNGM